MSSGSQLRQTLDETAAVMMSRTRQRLQVGGSSQKSLMGLVQRSHVCSLIGVSSRREPPVGCPFPPTQQTPDLLLANRYGNRGRTDSSDGSANKDCNEEMSVATVPSAGRRHTSTRRRQQSSHGLRSAGTSPPMSNSQVPPVDRFSKRCRREGSAFRAHPARDDSRQISIRLGLVVIARKYRMRARPVTAGYPGGSSRAIREAAGSFGRMQLGGQIQLH